MSPSERPFRPRLLAGGRSDEDRDDGRDDGRGPDLSDADLVARALVGGGVAAQPIVPGLDAFGVLVRRHEDRVLRLLRHLLGREEDARDVAQDAFLRAWRSLDSFRPDGSFRNWLLRIAVNAARDHWRAAGAGRLRALEAADDAPEAVAPGAVAEGAVLASQLRRLAAELNPREREVFVLRDLEGLETEEIARLLEIAEPTVRRHLARARLALRRRMGGTNGLN